MSQWGETKSYVRESKEAQKEKEKRYSRTKRWIEGRGFEDSHPVEVTPETYNEEWKNVYAPTLGIQVKEDKPKTVTNTKWTEEGGYQATSKPPLTKGNSTNQMNNLVNSSQDICYFCGKKVYLMEKKTLDGRLFHQPCFKCTKCSKNVMNLAHNFLDGKLYCKNHYVIEKEAADANKEQM